MTDHAVESSPQAAKQKKYGMFLGVFTPSILTILGVIMYQRFGWVLGNAGLLGTIGIVLLAHVISVTTGLSVASIATNHRVKTGGNYYMISRSLGLSIGGAIGLALYVALTLGVSLYLIGFAEAFLAAFPGFSPTGSYDNDIRLVGSLACAAIATLTLVDTSLALKSQLAVLALILLSLVSIFSGQGVPASSGETIVAYTAPDGAPAFAIVFAVFFPAVTGFTAGVGMSGDLKDPKKAIPWGTMLAIFAGLLIYLTLPVFIAEHASVEELRRNNNVLLKIARWPWMVTAGVWAATLSSAIGSILGAPRTLQALAFDGIVPRVLGRGRDEPRVALVATIIIAEAGILVAQLELVGSVITMFFLTSYGFLCLACGIERWANPDFRPQFKVPIWISLLGAAACFMVMSQINFMAMIGAIIIMVIIFAVLKRRQLGLGSSNAWGSLWSAVVRAGLLGLRQTKAVATQENWRPNMILMSRSGNQRAELIGFGRDVVGKQGILTHFELLKGASPRARVDETLEAEYTGMFARVQGTENIFKSIPDIAANFGFVGMETNVILLGWPRDVGHNEDYARMLRQLVDLDLSVLMLRLDTNVGFGKKSRIDIWWDGIAPTGPLMLTITHLLTSSPDWKNAKIRLLVNGLRGMDEGQAKKRLRQMVARSRLKAEAVLLSALTDEKSISDRIRKESEHADLVMIHAFEPEEGHETDFVTDNNLLLNPVGTTLLVRPSSAFADSTVIFDSPEEIRQAPTIKPIAHDAVLVMPDREELSPVVLRLEDQLAKACERFRKAVQSASKEEEQVYLHGAILEIENLRQLERRLVRRGSNLAMCRGLVDWGRNRHSAAMIELTEKFTETSKSRKIEGMEGLVLETPWQRRFREGFARLQQDLQDILLELPSFVVVRTHRHDWVLASKDSLRLRILKLRVRFGMQVFQLKPPSRKVYVRSIVASHLSHRSVVGVFEAATDIGYRRYEVLTRIRGLSREVARFFLHLNSDLVSKSQGEFNSRRFREFFSLEMNQLEDVAHDVRHGIEGLQRELGQTMSHYVQGKSMDVVASFNAHELGLLGRLPRLAGIKQLEEMAYGFNQIPQNWERFQSSQANALLLDIQIGWFTVKIRRVVNQICSRIDRELKSGPIESLVQARVILERIRQLRESIEEADSTPPDGASETENTKAENLEDKNLERRSASAQSEAANKMGASSGLDGEEADSDARLTDKYLKAADELRSTWADPYRPRTRELLEQLITGLGRAGDALPESVVTLSEAALDEISDRGELPQSQIKYPVRRLAQNFLEKTIAQPARDLIRELPDRVQEAQAELVDAVRLVAFDLEQQAQGTNADDLEEDGGVIESLALEGMLTERMGRLEAAQRKLEEYVEELTTVLLVEALRALSDVRNVVTGVSLPKGAAGGQVLDIKKAQGDVKRGLSRFTRGAKKWGRMALLRISLDRVKTKDRSTHAQPRNTLVDDFIQLRVALYPAAELQGSLPLIYRRIFGRAALENIDLLRGRNDQLESLRRVIEHWKNGMGGPIAILGAPRSGKSTLASIAVKEVLGDRSIIRVAPPPGGSCDPEELKQAIVSAVGGRPGQSAEIALRAMAPGAVLIVDGLGKWMERSRGGLAAVLLWRQLWRRLGDRHLFIITATPYAWDYVTQLCGLDEGFLDITHCDPVSRKDLDDLLWLRQKTSDFELDFAGPASRAERRSLGWSNVAQLKRLYERSGGNIGVALDIWRQSIVGVSERRISISIAADPQMSVLRRIPPRWAAGLAAIAIHESVSNQRMARIMRCSKEEAVGLLTDMERARLVMPERSGTGTYILDPVLQPYLLRHLHEREILKGS